MNAAVRCLINALDGLSQDADLEALFAAVRENPVTIDDVDEYVEFDLASYHRELIVEADEYQILILSWLPGQKSPIHNHHGSQCSVRVLQGTAVETTYSVTKDGFIETHGSFYSVESVIGGEDADIHTVENLATADEGLVTMHVYRPALTAMERFEVVDGRLKLSVPVESAVTTG